MAYQDWTIKNRKYESTNNIYGDFISNNNNKKIPIKKSPRWDGLLVNYTNHLKKN
jgi:hypothetical protein